jgi:hypothetical protein
MGRTPYARKSRWSDRLFIRDETTGQRAFNALALKALGIEPEEAHDRGYPLKNFEQTVEDLVA